MRRSLYVVLRASLHRTMRAALFGFAISVATEPTIALAEGIPIRIAFPSGMNGRLCVVMEKAGIARKHGLDAQFTAFQNGPPMMEALVAGSVDAVVTSPMPVTTYAAKAPGDVKIVALLGQSSYALIVAKESPVRSEPDLAGRTLGVSFGSDSHLDALIWLRQSGLQDRVSLVNVAPGELATALERQLVDAVVIRQPQLRRLQEQSGARVIRSWPHRYLTAVKSRFLAENPQAYTRYLNALQDTAEFIAQNPAQASAWFGEHLRVDPALIERVAADDVALAGETKVEAPVGAGSRALLKQWAQDAHDHKLIRTRVDDAKLFP